ncbi:MAG: tetratricopeptide repeat protein [bacterium]
MKRNYLCLVYCIIGLSVFATALYPYASSAETHEQWAAKIVSVQGSVEARRIGETEWKRVTLHDTYHAGDVIRVLEMSRAELALINQPILRIDQNSTIILGGLQKKQTSLIDLIKGAVYFFSRFPRSLEVHTAFVNAGVEGTEFFIRVDDDKTFLSIFEGTVIASNEAGSITLTSGLSALAETEKEPLVTIVARPRDAVQWALYYPPVLYFHPDELYGTAPANSSKESLIMDEKSREHSVRGDLQIALESIKNVPDDISDPRFFIWRASLLLSVGRVDEANADIDRALHIDSQQSNAFALQSIIAVVQNEKDKALILAQKAVTLNTDSAAAYTALSYALQSRFDLQGALKSLKEAVKLEPENALAWARLAELQLSFGNCDEALESAEKAVTLSPALSRTHTVLGFAYLTQVKIVQSKEAFKKAIEFDQASPLPRLGLGLAKIREGDLSEGREQLEIAVCLDPDNSLIRSYLGKAYFEEKRDTQSKDQYTMAKNFDPLDPTHFFYNAIRKQSMNRPVEALRDLEKAIALNDNRAIYRSRLLLDSDLAARSASLARIYSDLGFEQRALVEGWKSVNTDPSNFSAHRFLADSYAVLPRHEIARVSELLQSQLLQPLNIAPIQPRLAESNLFLMCSGGPIGLSFNEFNPLFNRDRFALLANSIMAENSTNGEEIVLSGIYKKISCSVGGCHVETDGYRVNNDLDDSIYNAFIQMELTHKTSIQAEYRYRHTKNGDLELVFDPNEMSPYMREEDKTRSLRLGLRHAISPSSIILSSFMSHDKEHYMNDKPEENDTINIVTEKDAVSGELQHLFRSEYCNITTGVGHFDIEGNDVTTMKINLLTPMGPLLMTNVQTINHDTQHTNLYIYSSINYPKNATVTIGVSGDFFDSNRPSTPDRDQYNPKFGITWNPAPSTTIRAAAFRVLKRTLITDQTLEPTQVAGFNQFFDDADSTDSWRYGCALDQKFAHTIYTGVEFSRRDLHVPGLIYIGTTPTVETKIEQVDWKEYMGRAHLFLTPRTWLGLSTEYQYERFVRDENFNHGIKKLTTHRVPVGITFFHTSGLGISLNATYINQDGDFQDDAQSAPGNPLFNHGEDEFWIADAAIRYRLPRRKGFLSIGAINLFNQNFQYHETDVHNSPIQPERIVFGRVTLIF